tara:strand:+ start:2956 stop:4128 length:1173 start_codon:yes stop_codon:yes gene_type:complete
MKLCVVGIGYVGLSLSLILSQKYDVIAYDIDVKKVDNINKKISPIDDQEIEKFLSNSDINLKATSDKNDAYFNSEYIIIATSTDYIDKENKFDTSTIEDVIQDIVKINPDANIVIKSTIPLGFTDLMRQKYNKENIFFSPEFLRESMSLYDNLFPSRIIVGDGTEAAKKFAEILISCTSSKKKNTPVLFMKSTEAEAVKLFSNTHLAMRVAYFNELDTFAHVKGLNAKNIIKGVCHDNRIGDFYNNPSFGYGGYCLPKDTKQLLSNFGNIQSDIVKAVIDANTSRKQFIVNEIVKSSPKTVGIFRLVMKNNSDNFRNSAVIDIMNMIKNKNINIVVYEPYLKLKNDGDLNKIENIEEFINISDIIIANRHSSLLDKAKNKIFTRDLFGNN